MKQLPNEFDLYRMIKSCNYNDCEIYASTEGKVYDEVAEDEYNLLRFPDKEAVSHMKESYKGVIWTFTDSTEWEDDWFELKYEIMEEAVHFHYESLCFKTKYTLVNIMKSQRAWKHFGLSFYDSETEDVLDDCYLYKGNYIANDMWLNEFDKHCSEFGKDSHGAALFKEEEKSDEGKMLGVLDLVIITNSQENG